MDKKNFIKDSIRDFQDSLPFQVLPRQLVLPVLFDKIITVSGVRRSGKTFLLYDTINKLLAEGVGKEKILFYSFDDERVSFETEDFDLILQSWIELYPDIPKNDVYIFFDEIQYTEGWEKFANRIYNTFTKHIFISGSNSALLITDIATTLRGRSLAYEVFPLSFAEKLLFKGIHNDYHLSKNKALIKNEFHRYLLEGGFPEVALNADLDFRKLVQNYYYVMLYKDIIERYNIKNIAVLKYFIRRTISNLTKPLSITKIYNEMRSAGLKADKNLLFTLADCLEATYLAFRLYRFDYSVLKQELTEKKQYFIDNGMINSISGQLSEDHGKLMENAIFLWLRTKHQMGLYFFKNQGECDFVILDRDKPVKLIQSCWDISEPDTLKREIAGLAEAAKYLNCDDLTIITAEEEKEIEHSDFIIKVVPAWKEMLKNI
jgi:hypothetical protein